METAQISFSPESGWSSELPDIDSPSTLVLAFGGRALAEDPAPLTELALAYPQAVIAGCSSAGQIVGAEVSDRHLDVSITRFEGASLTLAAAPVSPVSSLKAGRMLADALSGSAAALIFCDGLEANGSQLARGLAGGLAGTPLAGALAADGPRFERTWVLHDGRPRQGVAVGVGLSGPALEGACASAGGWVPFGGERLVTRSSGSVVFELGGEPALSVYRRYLGEVAQELPASGLLFPLTIRRDRDDTAPLVRTIIGIDETEQSLRFAGDIPEGHRARLMTGSPERLLDGAHQAASALRRAIGARPALVVAVSCVGRRLAYGPRAPEEAEIAIAELPAGSSQCGLFSYGEIGPCPEHGLALFNQTFTAIALRERAA